MTENRKTKEDLLQEKAKVDDEVKNDDKEK